MSRDKDIALAKSCHAASTGAKTRHDQVTGNDVIKGHRIHIASVCEKIVSDKAPELVSKTVQAALDGDMTAMRLCMDRVMPVLKNRPVNISIPEINTADDAMKALGQVVKEVAAGVISIDEGNGMIQMINNIREIILQNEDISRMKSYQETIENKITGE